MESAEDLLRTRSIKSLRALVSSLEASANAKQSELQLTVGSKYHEFIQSADCIAHMQNKADQLDQLIKHFSAASKVVLSQAQAVGLFIGGQNMIGESTSSDLMVGDEYKRIEHKRKINSLELSPKCLWHLLDRCNVFVAAQLIVMAQRVSHHSMSLHTRSDGLELYDINQSIPSYDNDSKDERKRSFFGNVKSCIFLRDTVLEDCSLLLQTIVPVTEKAKIFAAQSLLSSLTAQDMLISYLSSSKEKVSTHLKKLNDIVQSMDGEVFGTMSDELEVLIGLFQTIILEVYALFFKKVNKGDGSVVNGYIQLYLCHQLAEQDLILPVPIPLPNRSIPVQSSYPTLLSVFQAWFVEHVTDPSSRCAANVLSSAATSAEQVAILQKRLWVRMGTPAMYNEGTIGAPIRSLGHDREDWNIACKELFSSTKKGAKDPAHASQSQPWEGLWSNIFRGAFLAQVERQVSESCSSVLIRVRQHILSSLALEGLQISMISDVWTLEIDSNTITHKGGNIGQGPCQINFLRLQYNAERVRSMLEHDVLAIAGSSIITTQHSFNRKANEHEGEVLFSSTVFIKMSQLVTHILVLLREINSTITSYMVDASQHNTVDSFKQQILITGTALIGRIAWLFLARGSFLNLLLRPRHKTVAPQGHHVHKSHDSDIGCSSDQQIMSAFEIADINGDGLVTFEEAEEAIQALATGRQVDLDGTLLCPRLTPHLTYDEFVLLILHLQSTHNQGKVLNRVRRLLGNICSYSHEWMGAQIVSYAKMSCAPLLIYDRVRHVEGCAMLLSNDVKASWTTITLPGDEDGGFDDSTTSGCSMHMPSGASMALLQFFGEIAASVGAFTSTSSIECLLSEDSARTDEEDRTEADSTDVRSDVFRGTLVSFLQEKIVEKSVNVLCDIFDMNDSCNVSEELAMQAIVDVFVSVCLLGRDNCGKLVKLLEAWQDKIDPVDAVTYVPILEQIALNQISVSSMLLTIIPPRNGVTSESVMANLSKQCQDHTTFSVKAPARFSLLALPLSIGTTNKSPLRVIGPASVGPVSKPVVASAYKTSTTSASTDRGASIMSSLGSFGNSFLSAK